MPIFYKCQTRLSDGQMRDLALGLKSAIEEIGQVEGQERWDYEVVNRNEESLSESDRSLVSQLGLLGFDENF